MTIKVLNKVLPLCFLVYVGLFLIHETLERPRVLVLHSYFTNFSWVNEINVGVNRVLGDRPYNIRYHYMDTKRHPSLDFKMKAGAAARKVVREWNPVVILAFDDNAQEYVGKYFVDNPHISILYGGVNADIAHYGYDKAYNVAGISETIPWAAAKKELSSLLDKNSRLLHLSDESPSSQFIHESIIKFDWTPFKFYGSRLITNFDEWKKSLKEAEGKVDCFLITHYHTIKDPNHPQKVVEPATIMRWTEANTNLPTLGFWRFFVEDGGMMAVGLSPFEQGEVPGRMAIDIIEKGVTPKEIGHKKNRLFVMYIRKSAFYRRFPGKKIPIEIEAFADAVDGSYE